MRASYLSREIRELIEKLFSDYLSFIAYSAFVSGLFNATIAQIPNGIPRIKHGDKQGMHATMAATKAVRCPRARIIAMPPKMPIEPDTK